jgi:ribulose-bisphosphate carboxylase large chain
MLNYVDLKYKPSVDEVIVEYSVKSKNSINEIAEQIVEESSIGEWTKASLINPTIAKKLKPTVFNIQDNNIKISYPCDLFEYDNIPQILSSITKTEKAKLENISFPKKIVDKFKGPEFGVQGIRKITKIKKRPLLATVIKPIVLNEKEYALIAKHSWLGGCDIVKDDTNLTDQKFNRFKDRLIHTIDAKHKAENSTGETKIYIPNITAETQDMIERAKLVKKMGGKYIMIDVSTAGFSALQTIRRLNLGLIIHVGVTNYNISKIVLSKLSRLAGADQINIGSVIVKDSKKYHLEQRYWDLKPCFSFCSGNLNPTNVHELVKILGNNIIIDISDGINNHPGGILKGAMAARQSLEAVMKKKSIKSYAKSHSELRRALEKWG